MSEVAKFLIDICSNRYSQPSWAIHQIVRIDRIGNMVEDVCEHGVGHPNREWLKDHDPDGELGFGIHGCCEEMCCQG